MTFPPDSHMLVLIAVIAGEQLAPTADRDADELVLTVENGTVPADRAALDHLESVGWVRVDESGVVATEHGRRGAERWMAKVCGVKGRSRVVLGSELAVSGTRIPRRAG